MSLPHEVLAARGRIGAPYLTGAGIEIGARNAPTPLPAGASVRHVDRMSADDLRQEYRALADEPLVAVDVVDERRQLESIADASLDFVIANHLLQQCENPLGMLRSHLRKLKPGGWLFYTVPDARTGYDAARPRTTFSHLMLDDADGGRWSRFAHYLEWTVHVDGIGDEATARTRASASMQRRHGIHFHVWDSNGWLDFLSLAREYLGESFDVRHFEFTGPEAVSVLRRSDSGAVADRPAALGDVRPSDAHAGAEERDVAARIRTLAARLRETPVPLTPGARHAARLRDMLGAFSWAIDGFRIAEGAADINGWLYTRDADPASVAITLNGRPVDDVSIPGERPDVGAVLWYTRSDERRIFRLQTRLDGDDARASMLHVHARWSGGDASWYLPGPAAPDVRLPMPEDERITRVAGPIGAPHFRALGCNAFHTLRAVAARHGVDFGSAGDVLDWGVGCGRTERFWQGDARLVGCDVDADNVEWCRANLPGRYQTIATEPPTTWPDRSFDVIFGISVISHLRDEARRAWYGELQRLARPGALVMLSLLGDHAIATTSVDAKTLALIDERGSWFMPTDEAIDKLLGGRNIYGTTYQSSKASVTEAERWFDVLELVPACVNSHQDLLVLRRRP
jgi:SAM-dependent methyltransferase